jgi:hypothetical protein
VGCDPARKDWNRARSEKSIRGYRSFIAAHPKSKLVATAAAALDSLRFPFKGEGMVFLEAMEDSVDTCRCVPIDVPVRQFRALKETRVPRRVLEQAFHWNASGRIYHPKGSNELSGVMIDSIGQLYFGKLCDGNLMVAGLHRWWNGDLVLLPGARVVHQVPKPPPTR